MGYMVEGVYHTGDDVTQTLPSGDWERSKSTLRNWITRDGAPGPTGEGGFAAESGRYHLYVAWNCPWAHRTLLVRALKGLDDAITVSYARPNRSEDGWIYDSEGPFADPLLGVHALHQVYAKDAQPYTGRLTVPVLWDKQSGRIVSNESANIARMLNTAFDQGPDLYPADLSERIDAHNETIYAEVNNGVYRAGFASTQEAYERAAWELFEALDRLDALLADQRYLCGDVFTEADVRLFPTLARFDVAYHYAFRCNLKKLSDYANLWPYARAIYQMPDVAETVRFDIYKKGYFSASDKRNPLGIVPIGPQLANWDAAPER